MMKMRASILLLIFLPFLFSTSGNFILADTLTIPALNLALPVGEVGVSADGQRWNTNALGRGVGYLKYLAQLGDNGNIVIAGHYTLPNGSAGAFYNLASLQIGDSITLENGNVKRLYMVTEIRYVDPLQWDVIYPTPDDRLTLITCAGIYVNGGYSQRLVVIAHAN